MSGQKIINGLREAVGDTATPSAKDAAFAAMLAALKLIVKCDSADDEDIVKITLNYTKALIAAHVAIAQAEAVE
jgi:hypothetical protein